MKKRRVLKLSPVWYERKIVYNQSLIEQSLAIRRLDEKEFLFPEFWKIISELRKQIKAD